MDATTEQGHVSRCRCVLERRASRRGFTLVESLVVLAVLVVVGGVVLVRLGGATEDASAQVTHATLTQVRGVMLGDLDRPGYRGDLGTMPHRLTDLFRRPADQPPWVPALKRGWNGPYLRPGGATYGTDEARGLSSIYAAEHDPVVLDGWGRPVVLQIPNWDGTGKPDAVDLLHARLVSGGPDGTIQTPRTDAMASGAADFPTRQECGDDLVLYLQVADGRP